MRSRRGRQRVRRRGAQEGHPQGWVMPTADKVSASGGGMGEGWVGGRRQQARESGSARESAGGSPAQGGRARAGCPGRAMGQ